MMEERPELYFQRDLDWYDWLLQHHDKFSGVYLVFYKLEMNIPTMRWEEAVRVALCFGWIDSTVKSLGNGKRRQYFCPRKPKSPWSAVNKEHIKSLERTNLIHESGYLIIEAAKKDGSWSAMDAVEKGIIPEDLQHAFDQHPLAFENYQGFARGYRKSYLSWLHQAKRDETRKKRIQLIIEYCTANKKQRS